MYPIAVSAASSDCDKVSAGAWDVTQRLNSYKPPGAALILGLGRFRFAADETIAISMQIDGSWSMVTPGGLAMPFDKPLPSALAFYDGPYNPAAIALGVEQKPVQLAGSTTDTTSLSATFPINERDGVPAGRDVYPVVRLFESETSSVHVPTLGDLPFSEFRFDANVRITATCTASTAAVTPPLPSVPTSSNRSAVTAPPSDSGPSRMAELALQTNIRNVRVGKAVTLTVRAVPSSATGTVTFAAGDRSLCADVTLVRGVARCRASFATAGVHEIVARYSGDASFAASTSLPASLKVVIKR
jgi:hypothetical protein